MPGNTGTKQIRSGRVLRIIRELEDSLEKVEKELWLYPKDGLLIIKKEVLTEVIGKLKEVVPG